MKFILATDDFNSKAPFWHVDGFRRLPSRSTRHRLSAKSKSEWLWRAEDIVGCSIPGNLEIMRCWHRRAVQQANFALNHEISGEFVMAIVAPVQEEMSVFVLRWA
jgi:hypothetical protein